MPSVSIKAAVEKAACVAVLPALGFGIYCSVRLAMADSDFRLNTPESLAAAVKIEPGNAAYHQLLAEHIEGLGHDPAAEREKAVLLSPLESRYWIDLALMSEVRSDLPAAERYLLKAASVDRKFAPRWALMNFYFRQQRSDAFWQWTKAALPMAHDDASEIFRLCRMMTNDPESLRRMLPQTEFMRTQYLLFLMNDGHWESAPAAAREFAQRASSEQDVDLLLRYCDEAMTRNEASAVEVWNTMLRRKLEPFAPLLSPHEGAIVTNGNFQTAPIERGFDWRLSRSDGVSVTLGSAGVSVELTGEQAQAVTLLTQWLPAEKGQSYRIEYAYEAQGDNSAVLGQTSGLAWVISDPVSGSVIAQSEDLKGAQGSLSGLLDFTADAAVGGTAAARLSLRYARTPGTFRHEEKFTIRKVSSRLLPAQGKP